LVGKVLEVGDVLEVPAKSSGTHKLYSLAAGSAAGGMVEMSPTGSWCWSNPEFLGGVVDDEKDT